MPRHTEKLRLAALLALLAAASLLSLACDDAEGGDRSDDDIEAPVNVLDVTVREDGLSPATVEVRVPDHYQLVVTNETDQECVFDLGPWVRALAVPAGESAQIDFQVPPEEPDGETDMGCQGSDEQTGSVRVLAATALEEAD